MEVLEKDTACKELEDILVEYRKPVVLHDDILGELTYDKHIKTFEGNIPWLDVNVHISLYVDKDNKSGITKAKKYIKSMILEQEKWDKDMRLFAAKKLTKLACEWAESEEEAVKITEESFAKRIILSLICMTSGGLLCPTKLTIDSVLPVMLNNNIEQCAFFTSSSKKDK